MTINSLIEDYGEDTFMGLDMTELGMDEAYIQIRNTYEQATYLYGLNEECVQCPFTKRLGPLHGTTTTKLSTRFHSTYRLLTNDIGPMPSTSNASMICEINDKLGEFGVYRLETNGQNCSFTTLKEPVNIYLPILTVFLIYLVLLLIPISTYVRKYFMKRTNSGNDDAMGKEKQRLQSLDTFRGISIVLMIFVNYGGGGYVFMDHALWNGLQVADLVFPWFMWIMGVCIPMSIKSIHKRKVPKMKAFLMIFKRSCILFGIGLFLGSGTHLNKLRIFGVLQRFGICYFVVATLCLFTFDQLDDFQERQGRSMSAIADLLTFSKMWIVTCIILLVHCLLIFLVPISGCPTGYLGPGGYHKNGEFFNCTGGVTGYVDAVILGDHVYQYPTIKEVYQSQPFDPEGILGCLPSIIQVIIGVQAGIILLMFKSHKHRILRWLTWSLILGLVGGGLCSFSKEDGPIPLNKNLWSLSFVFVTSSLAFILLVICYVLIDVKKLWSGKPFLFAGMNAIVMYVGHSMTYSNFPVRWQLGNHSTHFLNLFENVWGTLVWVLVAFYLYKRKYFVSI